MRNPYENETQQEYTSSYLKIYQDTRTAVNLYKVKKSTAGYSETRMRELMQAMTKTLKDYEKAQNTYKEWQTKQKTGKTTTSSYKASEVSSTKKSSVTTTTSGKITTVNNTYSVGNTVKLGGVPWYNQVQSTDSAAVKQAKTEALKKYGYNNEMPWYNHIETTDSAEVKKVKQEAQKKNGKSAYSAAEIKNAAQKAQQYNQTVKNESYGTATKKNTSASVPKITAKTSTSGTKTSAKQAAAASVKSSATSNTAVIKLTSSNGKISASVNNGQSLLNTATNLILSNTDEKTRNTISKVQEVVQVLSNKTNDSWNKKVEDSKDQLYTNLANQGWTVPDDAEGRQALYEQVKEMSPDLFYNGMYVGTDSNALQNAKSAYKSSTVVNHLTGLVKTTGLNAQQQELVNQLLTQTSIKDIATNLVESKFQEVVDGKIQKALATFGYDTTSKGCMQAIQDIVRGSFYAKAQSQEVFQKMIDNTTSQITGMVNQKVDEVLGKYTDMVTGKITPALDKMNGAIDKGFAKVDDLTKKANEAMAKLETKMAMLDDIGGLVNGKLGDLNGELNKSLSKYGVSLDLSDLYKDSVNGWGKEISEKIASSGVKEQMGKISEQVKKVSESVQKYKEMIKEYQTKVKELVTKWVDIMKDKIKDMTQKLLSNLTKSVNVAAGSIKLNF